jgi:hypothetical protein
MAFSVVDRAGAFAHLRITGVMTLADQQALQDQARVLIDQGLRPRALLVLENFKGWEKGVDWGDMSFLTEHGDDIERMAIVGEERWRDEMLMFVAKGLRATEIEYFSPAELDRARQWVNR